MFEYIQVLYIFEHSPANPDNLYKSPIYSTGLCSNIWETYIQEKHTLANPDNLYNFPIYSLDYVRIYTGERTLVNPGNLYNSSHIFFGLCSNIWEELYIQEKHTPAEYTGELYRLSGLIEVCFSPICSDI